MVYDLDCFLSQMGNSFNRWNAWVSEAYSVDIIHSFEQTLQCSLKHGCPFLHTSVRVASGAFAKSERTILLNLIRSSLQDCFTLGVFGLHMIVSDQNLNKLGGRKPYFAGKQDGNWSRRCHCPILQSSELECLDALEALLYLSRLEASTLAWQLWMDQGGNPREPFVLID